MRFRWERRKSSGACCLMCRQRSSIARDRGTRLLCLFGSVWCLLAAAGCSGGDDRGFVTRLGPPDLGSRRVAREKREVLPALPSQTLPARLDVGCTIHIGHANVGSEGTLSFRAGLRRADEAAVSDLYSGSSRAGEGWTDAKIEVSHADVGGLILTCSPAICQDQRR